jgi:hypothetical protein
VPHVVKARAHTPLLAFWGQERMLIHGPYGVHTSPLNQSGAGIVGLVESFVRTGSDHALSHPWQPGLSLLPRLTGASANGISLDRGVMTFKYLGQACCL